MPASYESNSSLTAAALQSRSQCTETAEISQQPLPSSCSFSEAGSEATEKTGREKKDAEVANVYVQSLW